MTWVPWISQNTVRNFQHICAPLSFGYTQSAKLTVHDRDLPLSWFSPNFSLLRFVSIPSAVGICPTQTALTFGGALHREPDMQSRRQYISCQKHQKPNRHPCQHKNVKYKHRRVCISLIHVKVRALQVRERKFIAPKRRELVTTIF